MCSRSGLRLARSCPESQSLSDIVLLFSSLKVRGGLKTPLTTFFADLWLLPSCQPYLLSCAYNLVDAHSLLVVN
jgi:hypothetical protein